MIAPKAPMAISVMRRVISEHPEIDSRDEESPNGRARLLDYACATLNKPGQNKPWGRKARQRVVEDDETTGINLNTDGLTFLRDDGRFEIIDAISGVDGTATWDHHGVFEQGENGYWAPALSVDDTREKPGPVPRPQPKPEEPQKPVPSQPAHDYRAQLAVCEGIGDVLGARGSRYQGNTRAIGQVIGHLLWKVQFEGYAIQAALDNANRRARGEEAE